MKLKITEEIQKIKRDEKPVYTVFRKLLPFAFLAGLFVFCFFLHPQVILDYDDWSYVAYERIPVPWPTFWNPSRVLPELLMPLCGYAGAFLYRLFPGMGYIRTETLVFSILLSLMLFVYTAAFQHYLKRKLCIRPGRAALSTAMFFLFHFLLFRKAENGNHYLFQTANLTCCFFYLIPVLWNSATVMLLASETSLYGCLTEKGKILQKLSVLLLVYFGIFSNLYASIILAVFAGCRILKTLAKRTKMSPMAEGSMTSSRAVCLTLSSCGSLLRETVELLKAHALSFLILFLWGISVIFEAMGGRAGLADGGPAFTEKLSDVFERLCIVLCSLNPFFIVIWLLSVSAVLLIFVFKRKEKKPDPSGSVYTIKSAFSSKSAFIPAELSVFMPESAPESAPADISTFTPASVFSSVIMAAPAVNELLFASLLIGIYTVLLCAKVDTSYIERTEVLISVFSPLLAASAISLASLTETHPNGTIWISALLAAVFLCTDTPGRTFGESYGIDAVITPETCIAISQDVVDQVIRADQEGREKMVIDVAFNGDYCENWPQCTYLQEALIPALLKHGVISHNIEAKIFPSMNFDAKYGLEFPLLEGIPLVDGERPTE